MHVASNHGQAQPLLIWWRRDFVTISTRVGPGSSHTAHSNARHTCSLHVTSHLAETRTWVDPSWGGGFFYYYSTTPKFPTHDRKAGCHSTTDASNLLPETGNVHQGAERHKCHLPAWSPHIFTRTCVYVRVCACARVCVCARVCACARARVCMSARAVSQCVWPHKPVVCILTKDCHTHSSWDDISCHREKVRREILEDGQTAERLQQRIEPTCRNHVWLFQPCLSVTMLRKWENPTTPETQEKEYFILYMYSLVQWNWFSDVTDACN